MEILYNYLLILIVNIKFKIKEDNKHIFFYLLYYMLLIKEHH